VAISDRQRRARLGLRHRLADPAGGPVEVAESMVALHSSDPVTVYLSVWARCEALVRDDLESALYEERSLLRFYGMRRTLWVIPREIASLVHNSSTRVIGEREWSRSVRIIEEGGVAEDGEAWLERVIPRTLASIRARGEALARELTSDVPELAQQVTFRNKAGRIMGTTGMSTRTLFQLALESRVIRTRPAGTWVSSQYRWAEMESWLGEPLPVIPTIEAAADLLDRWLLRFGPATENDIRWWTGWTAGLTRQALKKLGARGVELADGPGFVHPGDQGEVEDPPTWVALLPSLDPTTMGWKDRSWFMGGLDPELFDRNGNAGPTVWANGQVVGGWAQNGDGEVVFELLRPVPDDIRDLIGERANALGAWLDGTAITPRFRTPLDRRLSG